jgi:hypothetical protein
MHGQPCHGYLYYRCEGKKKTRRGDQPSCILSRYFRSRAIEDPGWREIWKLICDPARLRRLVEAWAAQEEERKPKPLRDARKQLDSARAEEQRIIRMVRKELYDEDKGAAEAAKLREKIRRLEADVRALGKVLEIAPLDHIEAVCRMITDGGEPEGMHRRHVLDGFQDLKFVLDGEFVKISGKLPMDGAVAAGGAFPKNCADRVAGARNSYEPIPFALTARIAA